MFSTMLKPAVALTPCKVGRTCRLVVRADSDKDEGRLRGLPKPVIDDRSPKTAGPLSKFSIEREVLTGRLASFGMFSAVCGEVITGKGPLGQLAIETGLSVPLLSKVLFAIIAFNLVTGLLPGSPTWNAENQQIVEERGKKAAKDFNRQALWPLSSRNNFVNKQNELILGRISMLLFLVACIWDLKTGTGPLVWLNILPGGVPLKEAPLYFPLLAAPFLLGGIGAGASEDGADIGM